jgi:hypothetical protein
MSARAKTVIIGRSLLQEPAMSTSPDVPSQRTADGVSLILTQDAAPPVPIPPGHIGPVVLPGTGRTVWWTGRVAIGLRHQPMRDFGPITQSALWVQNLMLRRATQRLATA